jgi:hypothetical protein
MWQDLFNRSDLIARLAQGAWNPYLDEFVTFLQQQHYAVNTIRDTTGRRCCGRLRRLGIGAADPVVRSQRCFGHAVPAVES